ncbi:MAG: ABC transporter ATP-binding protein/permease [Defluviitaleaceae bacterium]|nr:ABC transporter ATP-binding protein/permease [Defluviitaleaceae bacterium]
MNSENENRTYDVLDISGDGMSTEKAKDSGKTARRMVRALMPQKWRLGTAFVFATAAVLLNLFAPRIFADAINVIFDGMLPAFMSLGPIDINLSRLGEFALMLAGIYLLAALFQYIQEFLMADVSQRLVQSLRTRLAEKLAKVPLKFYDTHKKGEIQSRITNDLERVNEILKDAIMRLYTSFITIIGALILMFRINWVLTLIALGAIFLGLIVTAIVSSKSNAYFAARQKSLGNFNAKIEEYFSGQVEVKTFNMEPEVSEKTDEAINDLYRDDRKAQFIMFVIMPIIRLFNQIGYVVIAGVGATFVITGRLNIGRVLSFFQYVQMAQEPFTEAAWVLNSLQSAIASAERVFEFLDEEEESPNKEETERLEKPRGDISFENVQFGYGDDLLMDGVNFNVKAGQRVAIVGPTGAGKTTLVNLLMRFYELRGGSIKIDGVDTRDFSRRYLRSLFGMVLQDSWIYDGTISENIAYGRHGKNEATHEEIVKAAKTARADYFIRTLPKGYETEMNDENANLSHGEKQLLCIARAIVANPHFLLLDEATSGVDTRTEVHIQKAMEALMRGRTSFVVAHRLSTIKNADMILVMDKGTIVETGRHEELLLKGGMYSEIYYSQFAA